MNDLPPDDSAQLALTVIISTLLLLLLIGVVVLLLVVSHNRRNRHRAQLAEERVRHAEEVRKVEQEVLAQTLTEVSLELHDNIGQMLSASRIGAIGLMDVPEAAGKAAHMKEILDTTIAEVRRLSRTLNPERLNELSLKEAIGQECERLGRLSPVAMEVQSGDDEVALAPDEKLVLFRIFQEAVSNTLKHAEATRITVRLDGTAGMRLTLRDNGRGFDVPRAMEHANGQGLGNLRRRAELIGYHCEVTSAPGMGTTIVVDR